MSQLKTDKEEEIIIEQSDNNQPEDVTPEMESQQEQKQFLKEKEELPRTVSQETLLKEQTVNPIEKIKKVSKKVALQPPVEKFDPASENFHLTYLKNLANRSLNGEGTINSSIVLLLILLIRFSPEFLTGDKIYDLYKIQIENYTNWKDLQYVIAFPYWPAAAVAYLLCFFIGLISIFYIMPSVAIVKRLKAEGKSEYFVNAMNLFFYYTHPIYLMLALIVCLTLSHGLFMIGLFYRIRTLVIVARVIFGFSDAIHLVVHTFIIISRYGHHNFALAFGFITSVKTMIFMIERHIPMLQSLFAFLLMGLIMCIISVCATISLPYVDLEKKSIFRMEDRDESWGEEPVESTSTRSFGEKVFHMSAFTIIHQALNFCLFLLYMFPFYYGGLRWNLTLNPNPNDKSPLEILQDSVFFSRAVFSPAIGALLDTEPLKIETTEKFGLLWFKQVVKGLKIHLITCKFYFNSHIVLVGLLGTVVTQVVFNQLGIFITSPYFYLFSFTLGCFFALSQTTILTIPYIFISNTQDEYHSLSYATYKSISYFLYNAASTINIYLIKSDEIHMPIWYTCIGVLSLVSLLIFFSAFFIYIGKKEEAPSDTLFKPIEEKEVQIVEEVEEKKEISWWWLLFIIPVETIIFLFFMCVFFFVSGIASFFLTRIYTNDHDPVRVYLLPTISILCLISMKLGFPDVLTKISDSIFFVRTRKALGLFSLPTIGDRLTSNPQFSMAHSAIELNQTLFRTLHTPNLKVKPILFVVPDEVVLENEGERFEFYEKRDDIDYMNHEDVYECSNGLLYVDTKEGKNVFSYAKFMKTQDTKYLGRYLDFKFFTEHFMFLVFIIYCFFVSIPIVFKLFHKLNCGTCNIPLFDDEILSITSSIRFIFGFFILIPFVGMWQEMNRILERLHAMILILKAYSGRLFNFTSEKDLHNLTVKQLREWDITFQHLQTMAMSKGVFLRYIFMFSVLFSKLFSVMFSVAALFVKFGVTPTIFQLTLLVIVMEISVLRFIIQPASGATTEFKLTILLCLQREKQFAKILDNPDTKRSEEETKKLKEIQNYMRKILAHWDFQVTVQEVGFSVKSNSIQTRWYITSELMRNTIQTFILTVVPSVTTYYVRAIYT